MKKLWIHAGLMLLLAGGCSSTHQEARVEAENRWDRVRAGVKLQLARQQFENQAFEQAIITGSEALGLDPTCPETYELMAKARMELGHLSDAGKVLASAAAQDVQSPTLLYLGGVLAERREAYDKALERFRKAQELDPTMLDAVIAEAETLASMEKPQEALDLIQSQVSKFDHHPSLLALAGHLARLLDRKPEALEYFYQALLLEPADTVLAESYGLMLTEDGRFAEAVPVLQPLVQRKPGHDPPRRPAVRRALARCYLELGNPAEAVDVLADWARGHTEDAGAQLLYAKACLLTGNTMGALRAADLVLSRQPKNAEALLVQAAAFWRRGSASQAAATLDRLLAVTPQDVEALCLYGEILRSEGRMGDASRFFRRAIDVDPTCLWARERLQTARISRVDRKG